jgi:hypothetical protein
MKLNLTIVFAATILTVGITEAQVRTVTSASDTQSKPDLKR